MISILTVLLSSTLQLAAGDPVAFLGVQLAEVPEAVAEHFELKGGAMVNEVFPGSPAEKAGLKRRDLILAIDGKNVEGPAFLQEAIRGHKPGDTVSLEVRRGDQTLKVDAQLGSREAPAESEEKKEEKKLELKKPEPGFLGIRFSPVPPVLAEHLNLEEGRGVIVDDVLPDSPAAKAKITKRDVIVSLAGKEIQQPREVYDLLKERKEGEEIQIELIHKGTRQKISAVLGARPKGASFDLPEEPRWRRFFKPYPGSPDRSWYRGRLHLKKPNGEDLVFEIPDFQFNTDELARELEEKFHDQMEGLKGLPQDLEKRLEDLLGQYKHDLPKFEWHTDQPEDIVEVHKQVAIARLVEGDCDITVREEDGKRTVTVKKGGEVLAQELPADRLETLSKEIQEKVQKAMDTLPKETLPKEPGKLKLQGEKTIKI